MLEQLKNGIHVVGAKQTKRAIADQKASLVLVAGDADPRVTEPIEALCREKRVPLETVPTMKELGNACGIAVGAAVAALLFN
ncbi:MAG: ribosomal protein L7ae [Oscillospiraceae bacterium]|nr:ribosomal protein L7ae [Oscillospiraceae bacterium]